MESIKLTRERIMRLISLKKKPKFLRHLWWKFKKFQNKLKWKRPRGKDNPMRLKLKGYPPLASVGYRTPKVIRGLHPTGLRPVTVHNVKELEKLNPSEVIIYVASTISLKKRAEIIAKARELGFKIANSGR